MPLPTSTDELDLTPDLHRPAPGPSRDAWDIDRAEAVAAGWTEWSARRYAGSDAPTLADYAARQTGVTA